MKNVESGVRLILLEMRDLKREAAEDRKRFLDYCRRADEDRKQFLEYGRRADDDRTQFLEYCRRADEDRKQFLEYGRRADEDRKRFEVDRKEMQQLIRVIAGVGVKIHKTQQEHTRILAENTHILKENTQILRGIHKQVRASGNGPNGPRK